MFNWSGELGELDLEGNYDRTTKKILTVDFLDTTITNFIIKGDKEKLINLSRVLAVALQSGKYSFQDSKMTIEVFVEGKK